MLFSMWCSTGFGCWWEGNCSRLVAFELDEQQLLRLVVVPPLLDVGVFEVAVDVVEGPISRLDFWRLNMLVEHNTDTHTQQRDTHPEVT